jgi:hypothetical protein
MSQIETYLAIAMGSICVATLIVSLRAMKLDKELHAVKHVLQAFIMSTINEVSELNDKVDSTIKQKKGKTNA